MIQELLDKYIKDKQEERKDRVRSGKIKASSLGQCFRRQIWDREDKEVSNPIDARTLRVFQCGDIFHEFIQRMLPEHETEVTIEEDDVICRADIVTDTEVQEIKSIHSRAFWHMHKEGYDIKTQKRNNIMQVCYPALKLKKLARLVFVSKDDLCIDEYTFDPKQWEDAINKELRTLRHWWETRKLPEARPRLYPQKDGSFNECKYCQFKTDCKEKEKENETV